MPFYPPSHLALRAPSYCTHLPTHPPIHTHVSPTSHSACRLCDKTGPHICGIAGRPGPTLLRAASVDAQAAGGAAANAQADDEMSEEEDAASSHGATSDGSDGRRNTDSEALVFRSRVARLISQARERNGGLKRQRAVLRLRLFSRSK